ncbi:MAG: hypothetical protein AAF485_31565, partial [Chloroflexota bacterium]
LAVVRIQPFCLKRNEWWFGRQAKLNGKAGVQEGAEVAETGPICTGSHVLTERALCPIGKRFDRHRRIGCADHLDDRFQDRVLLLLTLESGSIYDLRF